MPNYTLLKGAKHFTRTAEGRGKTERVQPGAKVELTEAQYESMKDRFEPAGATATEKKARENARKKKVKREDGKGFDVISQATGAPVNDEPLTEEDADKMLAT